MCLVSLVMMIFVFISHCFTGGVYLYCADLYLPVRNEMFALCVKYCYLSRSSFNSICCMLGFPGAIELF